MKDMTFTCILVNLEGRGTAGGTVKMANGVFEEGGVAELPPRKTVQYVCPVEHAISIPMSVDSVSVLVGLNYTRFGFHERAISQTLTWDANSKQWLEGDPIN